MADRASEVMPFRDGDFGDPATTYSATTYSATDPALVDALRAWFDHQHADHSLPDVG